MEAKHTPGPWGVDGIYAPIFRVIAADGKAVCYLCEPKELGVTPLRPEDQVNAHLMAAAPDHALLLAAAAGGRATIEDLTGRAFVHLWHPSEDEAESFEVILDEFGCPILPGELRTALIELRSESEANHG